MSSKEQQQQQRPLTFSSTVEAIHRCHESIKYDEKLALGFNKNYKSNPTVACSMCYIELISKSVIPDRFIMKRRSLPRHYKGFHDEYKDVTPRSINLFYYAIDENGNILNDRESSEELRELFNKQKEKMELEKIEKEKKAKKKKKNSILSYMNNKEEDDDESAVVAAAVGNALNINCNEDNTLNIGDDDDNTLNIDDEDSDIDIINNNKKNNGDRNRKRRRDINESDDGDICAQKQKKRKTENLLYNDNNNNTKESPAISRDSLDDVLNTDNNKNVIDDVLNTDNNKNVNDNNKNVNDDVLNTDNNKNVIDDVLNTDNNKNVNGSAAIDSLQSLRPVVSPENFRILSDKIDQILQRLPEMEQRLQNEIEKMRDHYECYSQTMKKVIDDLRVQLQQNETLQRRHDFPLEDYNDLLLMYSAHGFTYYETEELKKTNRKHGYCMICHINPSVNS